MSCADCKFRCREFCSLFDDVILSYADSCFMDSDKSMSGDDYNRFINRLNNDGTRKLNVNR